MTVVLHDHELIFLKTRKTAGTSVEIWLSALAGDDDVLSRLEPDDEVVRRTTGRSAQNDMVPFRRYAPRDWARWVGRGRRARIYNHMDAVDVRRAVGDDVWSRYLKVTVERDPYERAVSMFRWKTAAATTDIVDFLRRFPPTKLSNFDIYAIDDAIVADVILDHGHLDDDLAVLARRLGLVTDAPLPVTKARGRADASEARALLGPIGRRLVDAACRREMSHDLQRYRPACVFGPPQARDQRVEEVEQ